MASLATLPNELLDIITAELPTIAIARLHATCKVLQEYCHPILANRLQDKRDKQVCHLCIHDDNLEISYRDGSCIQPCISVDIGLLLHVNRNPCMRHRFTQLDISGANCSELSKDLRRLHLPNLNRLVLFAVIFSNVSDVVVMVKAHAGTLQQLALQKIKVRSSKSLMAEWKDLLRYLQSDADLRNIVIEMPWHQISDKDEVGTAVWKELKLDGNRDRQHKTQWFDPAHDRLVLYEIAHGKLQARGKDAVHAGLTEYLGRMSQEKEIAPPRDVGRLRSWLRKLLTRRGEERKGEEVVDPVVKEDDW
ncbi:hypothetical protein LTR85_009551 [Meristemomyces frigidus]|nr:hypothetical protein LTR85_009551 [Meristemomyces frigidus]